VPEQAHDSRWLHRPPMDWARAARAMTGGDEPEARVLAGLRHILARRAAMPAFHAGHPTLIRDAGQDGLFAFVRAAPGGRVLCLYNFTETWRSVAADWCAAQGATLFHDGLSDAPVAAGGGRVALPPYARLWLT
jgi:amylosucrase